MKSIYLITIFPMMIFLFACEEKLNVWEDTTPRIHFDLLNVDDNLDRAIEYSFVYLDSKVKKDTIYLKVAISGFDANRDRALSIEQIKIDSVDNAVANNHYVDFTSPELKDHYVIKKDSVSAMIPIVLIRNDEMVNNKFYLKVRIKENDNFTFGVTKNLERVITVSDYLTKPNAWNPDYERRYFGTYSQVKHRFMIVVSGKDFDEVYFQDEIGGDIDLKEYYRDMFRKALNEYNNNPANKDVPLKSEPIDGFPNGQIISFPQ